MSCEICIDTLPSAEPITTPAGLWSAVEWIRAEISAGRILRVLDGAGATRFEDLDPGNALPDYILQRFYCAGCGDTFEVSCETYHGCGGHLGRVG